VLGGRSLLESTNLRWQLKGRQPIEVERRGETGFQIVEPIVDQASAGRMKQLVDAWDSARMQATPLADDAAGQATAGLAAPEAVVDVRFGAERLRFEIGGLGPFGDKDSRYLRHAGKLWLSSTGLYESLRMGLDDLRERQVFRHAFGQAGEIKVEQRLPTGVRETVHLQLQPKGWQLLAPVAGRADPVEVQRFVTDILSLRVDEFPLGSIQYPEREPDIVVLVRGDMGEETLRLWVTEGQLFGPLPGRELAFVSDNREYVRVFENPGQRLRARILVPTTGGAFEELLELVADPGQGRGDRIRLRRNSATADWQLVEPIAFLAGPTPVNEAALAIQQLVALQFLHTKPDARPLVEDPQYGLGPGRWSITVRSSNEKAPIELWLGADAMFGELPTTYVCRADEPTTVVMVPRSAAEALRRPWTEYPARRVLQVTVPIERLELTPKAGGAIVYRSGEAGWVRDGVPGSASAVGDFVSEELRDMVGTAAVDVRGPDFATPDVVVKLARRNGDTLAELRLWDRGGDKLVAQSNDQHSVGFELSARNSRELRALWQ
jgi:hypothetical protein